MSNASIIGLISDTHGLLRPEAVMAPQGSDLIIHAGDIGSANTVEQLRALAPVVAVRGNIDSGAYASQLPLTAVVEAGSVLIYVLHDIHQLDFDPAAAEFNLVISGHSHKPGCTERRGVGRIRESGERRTAALSVANYSCPP